MFAKVLLGIWGLLWPVLLLIFILTVAKIIYRGKKYGYKEFSVFKKRPKLDSKGELLFLLLDRLPCEKKIFKKAGYSFSWFLLTNTGLSVFEIFMQEGTIKGGESVVKLLVQQGKLSHRIDNPFMSITSQVDQLRVLCPSLKITSYLIISPKCIFTVDTGEVNTIQFQTLYYHLHQGIMKKSLYTSTELDEFEKILRGN